MVSKKNKINKKAKHIILRAKLAFKNCFYLESSYLASLAMEARLRTIIRQNDIRHPGAGFTFEQCLKRIKFLILQKQEGIFLMHFNVDLVDRIREWKNQRNLILKAIESSHVSLRRLQNLAEEGVDLMTTLNDSFQDYKREWKRSQERIPAETQ